MRTTVIALAIVFGLACFGRAEAGLIFYSESITTDGSLGGTAFTGKLVTLTFTADTTNVTFSQGSNFTQFTNIPALSTVTVAGLGTAMFNDPISLSVSAFSTFSEFSVTDTSTSVDILDTFAVASGFAGYDMKGPLAPVSGGAAYSVGTLFGTCLGDFEFTKSGGGVSRVTATTPEPSSFAMTTLGIVGALFHRRRVRRIGITRV